MTHRRLCAEALFWFWFWGVVAASSQLYRHYGHLLGASNNADECITCTFLYFSEAILGAGIGPTCALGASFVYGSTRLSEHNSREKLIGFMVSLDPLGYFQLPFHAIFILAGELAGFLTSFFVEDKAWLYALSAVEFS